jgi:tRNA 5-methylaminomethyl-2-thiouridine biosynthesis bifunctional protein
MQKTKGFGRKRDMLVGRMEQTLDIPASAPWFARSASASAKWRYWRGIASALLSLALLHRGWQVTLYCADDAPASGASGNRQGALYPLLSAHDPALFQFFPAAFTFARRLYDALPVAFDHDWCGVTQLGWDERASKKSRRCCRWACRDCPRGKCARGGDTAGVETGCGGIQYPLGGWLCPAELTAAALPWRSRAG